MLGLIDLSLIRKFFSKDLVEKIDVDNSIDAVNCSSKINSKKLLDLKELIVDLEHFLPTNPRHLNATRPNHLDELKHLRNLVSKIKLVLGPNFKIIMNLNHQNFVLHDSINYCNMILCLLQTWDEHKLLTKRENLILNRCLVNFSNDMHDVLNPIKN